MGTFYLGEEWGSKEVKEKRRSVGVKECKALTVEREGNGLIVARSLHCAAAEGAVAPVGMAMCEWSKERVFTTEDTESTESGGKRRRKRSIVRAHP